MDPGKGHFLVFMGKEIRRSTGERESEVEEPQTQDPTRAILVAV